MSGAEAVVAAIAVPAAAQTKSSKKKGRRNLMGILRDKCRFSARKISGAFTLSPAGRGSG
jgi:hypothetical protein